MTAFKSFYDILETYLAYPLCLLIALAAGLALAVVYKRVKRGYAYTRFMPLAIAIIPVAMAALVGLLNARNTELETSDTIRVGVVLTAGVALTRFRSDKLAIEDMEGDFLYYLTKNHLSFSELEKMNLQDVPASRDIQAVGVNCQIKELYDKIIDQNFVPVVDDNGVFIGIVTRRSDILSEVFALS